VNKWLLAFGSFLAIVGFAILGRPERKLKKAVAQRDHLMLDNTKAARVKAKKLGAKADKLQAQADLASEAGKATVNKVGTQGETVSSILDSWRKPDGV
jgi:propanediol dehydratase small subunit